VSRIAPGNWSCSAAAENQLPAAGFATQSQLLETAFTIPSTKKQLHGAGFATQSQLQETAFTILSTKKQLHGAGFGSTATENQCQVAGFTSAAVKSSFLKLDL
jgi:hypothetical protein